MDEICELNASAYNKQIKQLIFSKTEDAEEKVCDVAAF